MATSESRGTKPGQTIRIDVHLGEGDLRTALRRDALAGLSASPKELQPKWFYDERGSQLFSAITELPEYYPTSREREILHARAAEIAGLSGATVLVELGSGTSEKTRTLLDALAETGQLEQFVPFDVSEATLHAAAIAIADAYPGVAVHAVVGDFEHHLGTLPREGRRMIAFLGSTIGNLPPATRTAFLAQLAAGMRGGDTLLIGFDLVKDPRRLEAAYDDAAGVTAAFNKNLLHVLNRELGADFDPEAFEHVARFDRRNEWIEMLLRSRRAQRVTLPGIDLQVEFAAGEELRTEISAKFRRAGIERELGDAGLALTRLWTDAAGDFALALAAR